jgi:hypothetical protein
VSICILIRTQNRRDGKREDSWFKHLIFKKIYNGFNIMPKKLEKTPQKTSLSRKHC